MVHNHIHQHLDYTKHILDHLNNQNSQYETHFIIKAHHHLIDSIIPNNIKITSKPHQKKIHSESLQNDNVFFIDKRSHKQPVITTHQQHHNIHNHELHILQTIITSKFNPTTTTKLYIDTHVSQSHQHNITLKLNHVHNHPNLDTPLINSHNDHLNVNDTKHKLNDVHNLNSTIQKLDHPIHNHQIHFEINLVVPNTLITIKLVKQNLKVTNKIHTITLTPQNKISKTCTKIINNILSTTNHHTKHQTDTHQNQLQYINTNAHHNVLLYPQ